jgi:hypothetical protein
MVSQDPAISRGGLECITAVQQSSVAGMRAMLRMRAVPAAAIAVAFVLSLSTAARAATIVVNSLADPGAAGICALRDAITAANTMTTTNGCAPGSGHDTIRFSVTGTIALLSTLPQVTDRLLMIKGPASPRITIDGGGTVQVMQIAAGAKLNLNGLTIAHGAAPEGEGGGIFNQGALTVTNTTFSGNEASFGVGGAIYNKGTLTVTDSILSDNFADDDGGIANDGVLTVTNSTFSGNSGEVVVGAIFNGGAMTVTNSTFSNNSSHFNSGAIGNGGTLTVTNSTFSANSGGHAGTLDNFLGGVLAVVNSTFSGNFAETGAGIDNDGTLTVTNSTFSGNSIETGSTINNDTTVAGALILKNTIVSGTISIFGGRGNNCLGTISDAGYNISDDTSCG